MSDIHTQKTARQVKDPVCGMIIPTDKTTPKVEHGDHTTVASPWGARSTVSPPVWPWLSWIRYFDGIVVESYKLSLSLGFSCKLKPVYFLFFYFTPTGFSLQLS